MVNKKLFFYYYYNMYLVKGKGFLNLGVRKFKIHYKYVSVIMYVLIQPA